MTPIRRTSSSRVFTRLDASEEGLQRFDTARLDGGLVHGGGVEIGDLALERAWRRVSPR